MDIESFLLSPGSSAVLLSVPIILFGLRLLNRRPFVFRQDFWVYCFFLFGIFPNVIPQIIREVPVYQRDPALLFSTIAFLVTFVLLLFFAWKLLRGSFQFHNVDKNSLRESLFEVLSNRHIPYDEKGSEIYLKGSNAVIKIQTWGLRQSASLQFRDWQGIPQFPEFLSDLKTSLRQKPFRSFPLSGIYLILVGVLGMVVGILMNR